MREVIIYFSRQFITIIFEKDGDKKPRSYSILSSPSEEGKLDLCIKNVEGGFASEIIQNGCRIYYF